MAAVEVVAGTGVPITQEVALAAAGGGWTTGTPAEAPATGIVAAVAMGVVGTVVGATAVMADTIAEAVDLSGGAGGIRTPVLAITSAHTIITEADGGGRTPILEATATRILPRVKHRTETVSRGVSTPPPDYGVLAKRSASACDHFSLRS